MKNWTRFGSQSNCQTFVTLVYYLSPAVYCDERVTCAWLVGMHSMLKSTSMGLQAASTHKSAKTHSGDVFVTCDLNV